MKGYKEAEKIDRKVSKMLEANPVTKENILDWLAFTRTAKTTFDTLMDHCIKVALSEKK